MTWNCCDDGQLVKETGVGCMVLLCHAVIIFYLLPQLKRLEESCFVLRPVHTIQCLSQLLLKFKEVSDTNEHFFEVKQCQKSNWIQKMDHVNRSSEYRSWGIVVHAFLM